MTDNSDGEYIQLDPLDSEEVKMEKMLGGVVRYLRQRDRNSLTTNFFKHLTEEEAVDFLFQNLEHFKLDAMPDRYRPPKLDFTGEQFATFVDSCISMRRRDFLNWGIVAGGLLVATGAWGYAEIRRDKLTPKEKETILKTILAGGFTSLGWQYAMAKHDFIGKVTSSLVRLVTPADITDFGDEVFNVTEASLKALKREITEKKAEDRRAR